MIKIAICCGGGFSSSALAAHLEKGAEKDGLKERAEFIFIPFVHLLEREKEVDIAMLCPHLSWKADKEAPNFHIPLYVIPPKLYGLMPVEDFIEDAEDILVMWEENPVNVMHFQDEPKALQITRMISHRKWKNGEKVDFDKILGSKLS